MRNPLPPKVERGRIRHPHAMGTDPGETVGAFTLRLGNGARVHVIMGAGFHWDHVSVSLPGIKRCPTWGEMCEVKDLFFEPDECVIQFHPSVENYINCHPYTLHLWRPQHDEIPTPPPFLVGPRADRTTTFIAPVFVENE